MLDFVVQKGADVAKQGRYALGYTVLHNDKDNAVFDFV